MAANDVPDGELHQAGQEREQGNGSQQSYGGTGMEDVFHGDATGDGERECPAVETEVRTAGYPLLQSRRISLD